MMTTIMATSVGVRELKIHAPRLVERAARGEQIVITRYGRPQARLGPLDPTQEGNPGSGLAPSRASIWTLEKRAFERLLPRLGRRYRGRYVAIRAGRVLDDDVEHEALYQRVWRKEPNRVFFIGRVGGPPPVIDMPGFDIE